MALSIIEWGGVSTELQAIVDMAERGTFLNNSPSCKTRLSYQDALKSGLIETVLLSTQNICFE